MAVPDGGARIAALLTLASFVAACSGSPEAEFGVQPTEAKAEIERTKEAADSDTAVELQEAAPPPTEEASVDEPTPTGGADPTAAVHFETATLDEEEAPAPSLYEAAEAEKRRRRDVAPAQVIITNTNLHDYHEAGQLTEMNTEIVTSEEDGASSDASRIEENDPEAYWRTRVRDARLAWRAAADRVLEVGQRVADLRYEFYAQDDPHYRDSQIKPAWDRAAIELEQARLRTAELEVQVQLVIEEGLRDGALPGWLREGMEFEPERGDAADRRGREPGSADSIEPPILEDPPR